MDHYDSSMLFTDLAARYQQTFTADLNITQLQNELSGFVEVKTMCWNITPPCSFAFKTLLMCSYYSYMYVKMMKLESML